MIAILFLLLACGCVNGNHNSGLFITLSFDDNLIEHYQAAQLLEDHGMRGTFYVNSGRLSTTSTYMSRSQVQDLESRGHEIGGHTINHRNLQTSSTSVRRQQICDDKENLERLGLTVSSFAFPFGADFNNAEQIFKECDYKTARDSGGIQTPTSCSGCPSFLNLPLTEPFAIRSISYRVDTGNEPIIQIINTGINDVKSQNRYGWLIFIFHEIGNLPNNPTSITLENYEKLVQHIYSLDDVAVVKTDQLIEETDFRRLFSQNRINATTSASTSTTTSTTSTSTSTTSSTSTTTTSTTTSSTSTTTPEITTTTEITDISTPTASPTSTPSKESYEGLAAALGISFVLLFLGLMRCIKDDCGMNCNCYCGCGECMDRCKNSITQKANSLKQKIKNIIPRRIVMKTEDIELDVIKYVNEQFEVDTSKLDIAAQFEMTSVVVE